MQPMKPEVNREAPPQRITFYPKPATLFPLLFQFVQFALLPELQTHHNEGRGFAWFRHGFALLICACVVLQVYVLFLQCGRVDGEGIRWRNRKGRCLTRWSEVTDFYRTIGSGFVVKTERDTILFRADLAHAEPVRDFIAARCGERLDLSAWELYGLRPRDFPQDFGYSEQICQRKARGGRVLLWTAPILLCGGTIAALLFESTLGGRIAIGIALLSLFAALELSGLSLARTVAAARKRAGQKFTTQADGFTYDTGREAVTVAWGDVIGYDFNPQATRRRARLFPPLDVLRLRTEQGQEFHFLAAIDRVELWKETVRRLATNGIETKIDAERAQALGGVGLCWSGGVEGVGDRVFHARTRANLFPLIVAGTVSLFPLAFAIADLRGWIDAPLVSVALPLLIAAGLDIALAVLFYTRRVAIGADGISHRVAWRRTHIPWREVAVWKSDLGGIRIDATDGTRLRFKPTQLAFGSRIAPLIEEHLRDTQSDTPSAATVASADR